MATKDVGPPTEEHLTFEEVLKRVSAADAQTFYRQAERFDDVAVTLQDVKDLLRKHRRALEEAWSNGGQEGHGRLDGLIRRVGELVAGVRNPGYSKVLRWLGDAVVDSQQRLRDLQEGEGADRDERARKILDDLSSTYRQMGASLTALPERTVAGTVLLPTPLTLVAPGGGSGRGAAPVLNPAAQRVVHLGGAGKKRLEQVHLTEKDGAPEFGRFSQYTSRPAARDVPAPVAFGRFAGLTVQHDEAEVIGLAKVDGARAANRDADEKSEKSEKSATPEKATNLEKSTEVTGSEKHELVRLTSEKATTVPQISLTSEPTPTTPSTTPTTTSPTQVPTVVTTGPAPTPSTPSTPPTVSTPAVITAAATAQATAGGTPAAHVPTVTAPTPAPAPSAPVNLSSTTVPPGNLLHPTSPAAPVGHGGMPGPSAPREAGVWLRADSGSWVLGGSSTTRLGREEAGMNDTTWGGPECPPEPGKAER